MKANLTFCALVAVHHETKAKVLSRCLANLRQQILLPNEIRIVFEQNIPAQLESVLADNPDANVDLAPVNLDDPLRLAKCLNYSIQRTACSHLIKVDVDDYNLTNRLQETNLVFCNDPEVKLVGSQMAEWDEFNHKPVGIRSVPTDKLIIQRRMAWRNAFNGPTIAIECAALHEIGGFPLVAANEDYACWALFIHAGYSVQNSTALWVIQSGGQPLLTRRNRWRYRNAEFHTLGYLSQRGVLPIYSAVLQGVRNFFGRGILVKSRMLVYPLLRKKWPIELPIKDIDLYFGLNQISFFLPNLKS